MLQLLCEDYSFICVHYYIIVITQVLIYKVESTEAMRSELNCPGFEMAAKGFDPCSFRLRVHLLKPVLQQCCRTTVLTIISSATEKNTFTKHKLYNGIYLEHGIYPEHGICLEHGIHSEHGIHPTL